MRNIPGTDVAVHPLCLGTNVFGWTADEPESFAVLDAYRRRAATSSTPPTAIRSGCPAIAGARVRRSSDAGWPSEGAATRSSLATKVGPKARPQGVDGRQRARRHRGVAAPAADRPHRPAIHAPRRRGHAARGDARRARRAGARGQGPPRRGLQRVARAPGGGDAGQRARGTRRATSPCSRTTTSSSAATSTAWPTCCRRHDLGCLPYFALAKGFLTGKYRPGADEVRSERAEGARAYLDERGERVLAALDAAAAAHEVPIAAVSLAWLAARPTVVSPIASARTPEQLAELMAMSDVELTADEVRALDEAGA